MAIASALLAVVVGGAFAVVLIAIDELRGTTELRRQTRDELVAADTLEKNLIDLETGLRGFVITRDESFLEPSKDALAALPTSGRALENLAIDEPVQRARVGRLVRALNEYLRRYALPLVAAVRRNDPSVRSVERTVTAKQRVDALREGFTSFREAERSRLSGRDADVDQAARRATTAAAVGVGGSIVLIILFSGYLTRVIVQPLRRAALMANRLAGGDLSTRMAETDVAEIGTLGRSFNVMAGSLETSRDELASLLAEQAALRRVATLVAREASQAEVFTVIAEEIGQLLGTDEIRMLRYQDDDAVVVASAGEAKDILPVGSRQPLGGDNAVSRVFRTGQPARLDDYRSASGPIAQAVRSIGIRGVVGTPILVEGRLWGAMAAATTHGEALPPETESRLGQFTELMATTIANTDSRARADRLTDAQAALRRVATLVARETAPNAVFAAVGREVGEVLGVDATHMGRFDPDGTVVSVAQWGYGGVPIGTRYPLEGDSVSRRVLRTGRPARMNDYENAPGPIAATVRGIGIRSSIGVPISVEGRPWGVMIATTKGPSPFPAETESRLQDFTELVAAAISNASAHEKVRVLADEQAALRRVATLVAEGAPAGAVFDAVAGEMERLLEADQVALNRFEPGEEILVLAHRGLDVERTPVGSRVSIEGESVTATVRRSGRPARMEGYDDAEGPLAELARATGLRSSVAAPIVVDRRLWGLITASWTGEQSPPAETEQRMSQFAQLLETAIANAEARTELMASRARLVAASDEARRRFERDLHDGIQQRLVSLSLELRSAEAIAGSESTELVAQLSLIGEGFAEALDELRELARGIHPAILSEGGLVPALNALARRSAIPVRLDLAVDERLADHVEVGAYYVVSEALTNAAKHAQASKVEVQARPSDGVLALTIGDDGVGGADPARGSGLTGLVDRVEALGGTIAITSPPGQGTSLRVELPLVAR
jgi:signal transduction histidine kinase/CHASE3 domain sensor protein